MRAFGRSGDPEKSISGNSDGTRNPANTFFRYQARLSRDHTAHARKLYTGRREGRKTRGLSCWEKPQIHSKFPDDRVEHFARPHPVVTNVRPYGPNKLSVLAAHKADFRMDRKWVRHLNNFLPSSRLCRKWLSLLLYGYIYVHKP